MREREREEEGVRNESIIVHRVFLKGKKIDERVSITREWKNDERVNA